MQFTCDVMRCGMVQCSAVRCVARNVVARATVFATDRNSILHDNSGRRTYILCGEKLRLTSSRMALRARNERDKDIASAIYLRTLFQYLRITTALYCHRLRRRHDFPLSPCFSLALSILKNQVVELAGFYPRQIRVASDFPIRALFIVIINTRRARSSSVHT